MSSSSRAELLAALRTIDVSIMSSGPGAAVYDAAAVVHADDVCGGPSRVMLGFAAAAGVCVDLFADPRGFFDAALCIQDNFQPLAPLLIGRLDALKTVCPLPVTRVVVLLGAEELDAVRGMGLGVAALAHAAGAVGAHAPATLVVAQAASFHDAPPGASSPPARAVAEALALENLGDGLYATWGSARAFRRALAHAMDSAHQIGGG